MENPKNVSDAIRLSQTDAAAILMAGVALTAEVHTAAGGHPYTFNPITGETTSLERFLPEPLRQKTQRSISRVDDFIAYVNRFKKQATSIYLDNLTYRAEIDHREAAEVDDKATTFQVIPERLTWGDHSVSLTIERSESLKRWLAAQNRGLSQEEFAELLEERNMDIALPTAAEMLEVVQDLHITKNAAVTRAVRSNGKHSITFAENTEAKGLNNVDLPTTFTIRTQAFARQDVTIELIALLRVRLRDAHPTFVFQFIRLEEELELALQSISDRIKDGTSLPLYV